MTFSAFGLLSNHYKLAYVCVCVWGGGGGGQGGRGSGEEDVALGVNKAMFKKIL